MSTAIRYLDSPEFADDQLTASINVPPYKTGRPAQLGIFTDTPIATTSVRMGIEENEVTVIPARERGGESNLNMSGGKKGVTFDIPHFPLDDAIKPADIQNLNKWGADHIMIGLEDVYNSKLEQMRSKHDLTHSYLDWGALNGQVLDGEGKLLLDLWSTFDLAETSFAIPLDTVDILVSDYNRKVKARLRKELRGTAASGVRVLAGANFFDRYVSHQNVREELKAYKDRGEGMNPGRDDIEDIFVFAGLTLERIDEEYGVRQANGTLVKRPAIDPDEAVVIPVGTPFFKRYIAPPDTLSEANRKPDTKVFVSTETLPHDKGKEIHTESNVLSICVRPQLMIRLTIGDDEG